MTDIVERLRDGCGIPRIAKMMEEAADEIEQLKREQLAAIALIDLHREEIERLKLDRASVKRSIEELLERYARIIADTHVPHHGVGRGGMK